MERSDKKPGTKAATGTHTGVVGGMQSELDFQGLVREQYAALFRFALSLTRNEPDACDLAQQTFYLWATKGHQLEDRTKVKGWLFTTLHRDFLARQRRLSKFPHHELAEVEAELPETPPTLPLQLDWEVVADCLAQIDPRLQAPVSLFYLEDYSYNEIAEILEIPLGTVKSRMSRGIARLQELLSQRISQPKEKTV